MVIIYNHLESAGGGDNSTFQDSLKIMQNRKESAGSVEMAFAYRHRRLLIGVSVTILFFWIIRSHRSTDNPSLGEGAPLGTCDPGVLSPYKLQLAQLRNRLSACGQPYEDPQLPTIYAITPTYTRPVQKAELTRLSHTLMLVPNLHWVIVEDSETKTDVVAKLLRRTGLPYTHINIPTPKEWKLRAKEPRWNKPRGVLQRNAALRWVRENVQPTIAGVIYFVDDDNAYSLEVFDEMRWLKGVGVWPVGLVGGLMVERPKINSQGKVEGWLTVWSPQRPFAIDMAGFAISLELFWKQEEYEFAFEVEKGYQESVFLKHFVKSLDELEVKADNCTKVYVWHTRTEAVNLRQEEILKKNRKPASNVGIEV